MTLSLSVYLSACLLLFLLFVGAVGLGLSHVMDDEGRCGKMTRGGGSRGAHAPNPSILQV